MMDIFCEFTRLGGQPFAVDPERVLAVYENPGQRGCALLFGTGEEDGFLVAESLREAIEMLSNARLQAHRLRSRAMAEGRAQLGTSS